MEPKYDAVLFVNHAIGRSSHRINAGLDFAEKYLEKPVFIREVCGGRTLATRSSGDTLYFAKGHDLEGQNRYTWETGTDGAQLGTLKDEAKA